MPGACTILGKLTRDGGTLPADLAVDGFQDHPSLVEFLVSIIHFLSFKSSSSSLFI